MLLRSLPTVSPRASSMMTQSFRSLRLLSIIHAASSIQCQHFPLPRLLIIMLPNKAFGENMLGIVVREHDSPDIAIRKFKRLCENAGIVAELRRREHYEKPSVRRKKKSIAARKKKTTRLKPFKSF